jgi:large conductance mechanosensitive channel
MSMLKEFRDFALRGNVVDMAIGVIIGGAFGGIVTSLIKDMIMPIIGMFGTADFSSMYYGLGKHVQAGLKLEDARAQGAVLAYGNFITVVINFLIMAFVIFLCVKAMNTAKKKFDKEQAAAPPPPAEDIVLLLTDRGDPIRLVCNAACFTARGTRPMGSKHRLDTAKSRFEGTQGNGDSVRFGRAYCA